MTSIRTCFAVLLSAAMCLAQTASTKNNHHPTGQGISVASGALVSDGLVIGSSPLTTWSSPTTLSSSGPGITISTVSTAQGMMIWDGQGYPYVLNDMTTGVETRPLDNNGPTVTQVEYSAVPLDQARLAPASYLKLAKAINLESPSTDEAQILQTIYSDHLRVYDFDKVDNYLYRQALTMGARMRWVWKPMREVDLKTVQDLGARGTMGPSTSGIVFSKLYGQKIPERILADAKCVLDEVPGAVFLVSDFEAVKPDPFLAITTPKLLAEGKLWIVDRWDEPGFQDGKVTGGKGGGDVVRNQSSDVAVLLH